RSWRMLPVMLLVPWLTHFTLYLDSQLPKVLHAPVALLLRLIERLLCFAARLMKSSRLLGDQILILVPWAMVLYPPIGRLLEGLMHRNRLMTWLGKLMSWRWLLGRL